MRAGLLMCVMLWCAVARAAPSASYAMVVGSNAGGPGQGSLRYAEDDARSVAAVLTELGGYTADRVEILSHPTPDQLRDRLGQLAERVQRDTAAGTQVRVFFYYSGHARAQAIDLGNAELPLDELRERLFKIGASLTVVVLDACQSGAFSRIKGAAPAADFSYSSRQRLDATGVAVMASSSGSELSQESEQLRSSYFTHHLLVGLRGAGDANGDGEVSIDEAYRYAYHQTLLATAETAVGGQHVTFEAELRGHGEVALSFPRAASSQITLPSSLQGKTLVEDRRSHSVVAETYKARGAAVRIAVAPGAYDVLVRDGDTLSRCTLTAPGELDLARCKAESLVDSTSKGGLLRNLWTIEAHLMVGTERRDDYTANLSKFGYTESDTPATGLGLTGLRRFDDTFSYGATARFNAMPEWSHGITGANLAQHLDWNETDLMAALRVAYGVADDGVVIYTQLAGGAALGATKVTGADSMRYSDHYLGWAYAATFGVRVQLTHFGIGIAYETSGSTAIKDLLGNTHSSGGERFGLTVDWEL
jgi:hypothetical protein